MSLQQTKYELLKENPTKRWRKICLYVFISIAFITSCLVALSYRQGAMINIPPISYQIPQSWELRILNLAEWYQFLDNQSKNNNANISDNHNNVEIVQLNTDNIRPAKTVDNYIYSKSTSMSSTVQLQSSENASAIQPQQQQQKQDANTFKLVCYYNSPNAFNQTNDLYPDNIDPNLCTHINVGMIWVTQNQLVIENNLREMFKRTTQLKKKNPDLKVLIWVGGAYSPGFSEMVANHANRKEFIQSLKLVLETYALDGIDIDWEFPSAHNRERQHFSQLLREIRREYQREHRTYLLSVAVAAPEGIVFYAYDINEINKYVDFVNIMTYDYHFYSPGTPFTGFNAPLYHRSDELGILGTLNINHTVTYWHANGLDKNKIIIGLPTYGHSFKLVNALNTKIGSPASAYGRAGSFGFVTYADVCWFKHNNIYVTDAYDEQTCSPYVYAGTEWISYENLRSIECKTNYVKDNGYGGVMIFSLNTDDYTSYCYDKQPESSNFNFPLVWKINSILFDKN